MLTLTRRARHRLQLGLGFPVLGIFKARAQAFTWVLSTEQSLDEVRG